MRSALLGLLCLGAAPVMADTWPELALQSEHPVEGMRGGNLSGLAVCAGELWAVSDRDDDQIYRFDTREPLWHAEALAIDVPPPPESGLPWGVRMMGKAISPLRGKILNTWEVDGSEVLASQEVHNIAVAIGVDPGAADMSQLRYGKICILADADSDGLHIATLLCALFVQHFRPLVDAGHVYVAMPPLYRIDLGKEIFYALDEAERDGILDRLVAEKKRGKPQVTRFKGLGEMNPPQLRETTMDPNTRRLVQLTLEDFAATSEMMDMLLAKKRAGDRKSWLESKGNLAQVLA